MTIAITGTTGHIGGQLVHHLLEAKADLTLLLRNPAKLDASIRNRVTVQEGELQDGAFVRRATEGAEALFWITPGDPTMPEVHAWYDLMGANVAAAIHANGIRHVVNISSVGAQLPNAGPISGLGQVERHINHTDAHVIHLRPGFFMENLMTQLDAIRSQNSFFNPAPGDIPLPQIATRDIAESAARLLRDLSWTGKRIQGLQGPVNVSFNETAAILSKVMGRPIHYVAISPEQARQALLGVGFGPAFTEAYLEMFAALAKPGAVAEPRTPETTTTTTLAQWAESTLKPALNA